MEIIASLTTKVAEYTIDAIFHQLGYLVHYKDNMKGLQEEAENLVYARSRVQRLIDEAKDKAEDVEEYVHIWLTEVDEITDETYRFLINIGVEKEKNCFHGLCINLFQRHRLSKRAKKMVGELANIQEQEKSFDKVSYRGPLQWIETVPGYMTFESRMLIIEEIIKALKDPNINMIGVHGMGGVGKTMLVKEISCQLKKSKLFEPIIMATVGQNVDVKHIQGLFADMLNLTFHQETEEGRAALLRKRLQMEKNILIIIDDIWNGLDLETVGIPSTNDCKGCKILVTSRSEHVLTSEMSIEINFEVKDLTKEESWEFFKNMVDESIETNHELNKIAVKVASKCGKLPIALATVAKALKRKDLHAWRNALRQLQNPATVDIGGVNKEVYASLKLSYDYLNNREVELLFLLCSVFPDDYNIDIDVLSSYVMGLKFLQGVDSLGTTRDKILTMVDKLESSCLLQKSEFSRDDKPSVKMHDVVRDVAIYIASKDDQMRTSSYGKGLIKWQDEKTQRHYTAIYADCENFEYLPEKFSFPELELLTLVRERYWIDYLRIPDGCFEGMKKLKVLHLNGMRFSLMPSSSNYLVNLRTLLLVQCKFRNIDMIGELKNLEILDFSKSDIMELPMSIRQLLQLKRLNVSSCHRLQVIPPGVISRLTKLEELNMNNGFNKWGVEGFDYSQKKNASLSELDCLPYLTSIYIWIPMASYLPEKTFLNMELERFYIIIGDHTLVRLISTYNKILEIRGDSTNIVLKEGVKRLWKKCEVLSLFDASGMKNVVLELSTSVSPHLRELTLWNNEDIEYLVSELDQKLPCKGFSILESLELREVRRLVSIIQVNSMKTVSIFEKLKKLVVSDCNKMKYLFPFSIMEGLSNLEELQIYRCVVMETIVVMESEQQDKIELRKLTSLTFASLPQLMSFCGKLKAKELSQSQSSEIVEEDEDQLIVNSSIVPFNCQIAFPNLKFLRIQRVHNVKNIWNDLSIAINFTTLGEISLIGCENLTSAFTDETVVNIKEVQKLIISDCKLLEEVFRIQKLYEGDIIAFSSKLDWLVLGNLPNLKRVWDEDPDGILISFPSLRIVEIWDCPKLERLFPSSLIKHLEQLQKITIRICGIEEIFTMEESKFECSKVSFPNLLSLEIESADNLKMIWHNRLIIEDMSKLAVVKLDRCKNLKIIFTSNVMRVLKQLKEVQIRNCDLVEKVFEINEPEEEDMAATTMNLRKLQLCNLPSLKHVWSNDPDGMYHFENLNDVEVIGCPKLITPFPPALARDLPHQLQRLHVDDPLGLFSMKQENTSQAHGVKFNKVTFINLTTMKLNGEKGIRELRHPNFSKELFPVLKVLELRDVDDCEWAPFSFEFHQLLYGLEKLVVSNAPLVEIYSYDKVFTDEENQCRRYSAPLKDLRLIKLPKLLHIWKDSSHGIQQLYDNLEVVEVADCGSLNTLVISSLFSFKNLKRIDIYRCHGLKNLLDPGVAKTLVRLKEMKLSDCKSITTVLAEREDDSEENEIVFSELELLRVYDLPKLKSFQSSKYCTIRFPKLETLSIPKMKIFSPGIVCTPLLKGITVTNRQSGSSKECWEGNINDTLSQLWEDGSFDSSKEENLDPN